MTNKTFPRPYALILAAVLLLLPFAPDLAAQQKADVIPFISAESMPDMSVFLPAPPSPGDALYEADLVFHNWGKTLRDTPRGEEAARNANSNLTYVLELFSEAVGYELSLSSTPAIYVLLSRASYTASSANTRAKKSFARTRPYVTLGEGTLIPQSEEGYRNTYSYPSGHTTRGWAIALILSELFPEKADVILSVGYQYGMSRIIAGYHYESDVDAARTAASASVAVMHSNKDFNRAMKKAAREAARLRRR